MSMFDWVKCDFQAGLFDNSQTFQTKDGNGELALFLIQECGHMIKIPPAGFTVYATPQGGKLLEVDPAKGVTSDDYLGDLTHLTDTFEFYTPAQLCKVRFVDGTATEITIDKEGI